MKNNNQSLNTNELVNISGGGFWSGYIGYVSDAVSGFVDGLKDQSKPGHFGYKIPKAPSK